MAFTFSIITLAIICLHQVTLAIMVTLALYRRITEQIVRRRIFENIYCLKPVGNQICVLKLAKFSRKFFESL